MKLKCLRRLHTRISGVPKTSYGVQAPSCAIFSKSVKIKKRNKMSPFLEKIGNSKIYQVHLNLANSAKDFDSREIILQCKNK